MAGTQGISFCNIAKKAQELGRKNLAIKVINLPFHHQSHLNIFTSFDTFTNILPATRNGVKK